MAVAEVCHSTLFTLPERRSQAPNGFWTTASQVEAVSFAGESVHIQIHSLAHSQSCVTERSGTVRVSASVARRRTDSAGRRSDELNIHANDGLDVCGVDFVLVRTVLVGTGLDVVHAIAQVHCEILPNLGELTSQNWRYVRDQFPSRRWFLLHLRSCPLSHRPSPPSRSRCGRMAQKPMDRQSEHHRTCHHHYFLV